MIKKTLTTLKQHPIILLAFMLPFAYTAINYTVFLGSTFQDVMNGVTASVLMSIFSSLFTLVYSVGFGIFLFPSLMYYIYELAAGKKTEGWYKRGLEKCWWRNMVFSLVIGLVTGIASIPIVLPGMIIFAIVQSLTVLYVMGGILIIFVIIAVDIVFTGKAAVFAEDDFGTGLSAMFTAGFKNFWRVLPLVFISMIPSAIIIAETYRNGMEANAGIMIAASFLSSIFSAFAYVYVMNCYVERKNNQLVNQKTEDVVYVE